MRRSPSVALPAALRRRRCCDSTSARVTGSGPLPVMGQVDAMSLASWRTKARRAPRRRASVTVGAVRALRRIPDSESGTVTRASPGASAGGFARDRHERLATATDSPVAHEAREWSGHGDGNHDYSFAVSTSHSGVLISTRRLPRPSMHELASSDLAQSGSRNV